MPSGLEEGEAAAAAGYALPPGGAGSEHGSAFAGEGLYDEPSFSYGVATGTGPATLRGAGGAGSPGRRLMYAKSGVLVRPEAMERSWAAKYW